MYALMFPIGFLVGTIFGTFATGLLIHLSKGA